ncbi:DUF2065 domain-containing protein [Magnetococcales bacterium HHB-1]
MDDFLVAFGLLLIFEGLPYFISPSRMRQWIMTMTELSDGHLRQAGFFFMIIGLTVIYMVRG